MSMAAITINVSGSGMIPSSTQSFADFVGILSASTVCRFRTLNLPTPPLATHPTRTSRNG